MEAIGKLDKFNLHGKDLSVELAKDRRKAPDEMKDRTRQAPAPHGARRSRSRSRENNHRGGGRAEGGGYMHEYHRGPPPPDFRMRSDYYRNDYFQRDFPPRDYPRDYQRDYPPRRDLQDRYYYNVSYHCCLVLIIVCFYGIALSLMVLGPTQPLSASASTCQT